jgi:hypothetical protein
MDSDDRKVIGLLVILAGAAIIAPKETGMLLEAISSPMKKPTERSPNSINNETKQQPVAQTHLGVVRKTKQNIVNNSKKFWRWFY